jgi:hypothetical protein
MIIRESGYCWIAYQHDMKSFIAKWTGEYNSERYDEWFVDCFSIKINYKISVLSQRLICPL